MDATDWQLLEKFSASGSQAAFSALTRRYANLVYRVCQRELGDTLLAEDAAQAVFLLLAQKAPSLRPSRAEATLSSWLFQTALLTAKNVRRSEGRRQAREQEAGQMLTEETRREPAGWAEIEPHLNDALHALPPGQRTLIFERYFQDRPLAEIGAGQGISEDAARMRVNRALDRLRRFFASRNIALSAAALASLLPQAVRPAPSHAADLLARLAVPAPGGTSATPTHPHTIAQEATRTMNVNRLKLQLGAAALTAVFVLGTAGAVRVTTQRKAQAVRAEQQQSAVQAHAVLDQMYATYAAMKSFDCFVTSREDPLGTAQNGEYEIVHPNKVRFHRDSLIGPELSGEALAVSDGKTLYVTCTEAKGSASRYAKIPLGHPVDPSQLATLGGIPSWGTLPDAGMPNAALGLKLSPDPLLSAPKYLLGQAILIKFPNLAQPVALDVVTAQMSYRAGEPSKSRDGIAETVTWYIGRQDHLLYQVATTSRLSATQVNTRKETIINEVNSPFDHSDFVFVPPAGSHKVTEAMALFPAGFFPSGAEMAKSLEGQKGTRQ